MRFLLLSLLLTMALSAHAQSPGDFQIHGHRGARGHLPENTIASFRKAVTLGANWLELDLVVSKDEVLVVSHEPWMHQNICLKPDGSRISGPSEAESLNIFTMSVDQVKQYDCGQLGNEKFEQQHPTPAVKPTFKEMVEAMEALTEMEDLMPVYYNIEIKSKPKWENSYQPRYGRYARLILKEIRKLGIEDRCFIQSFDPKILNEIHIINDTDIPLGYLTERPGKLKRHLKKLQFTPYAFNPYYKFASEKRIEDAHELGIKVIPWTVNDPDDMRKLIKRGVDGIITDYPDRLKAVLEALNKQGEVNDQ